MVTSFITSFDERVTDSQPIYHTELRLQVTSQPVFEGLGRTIQKTGWITGCTVDSGVLGLLLNRRSGLSIRNGVLLYKPLIRPMMDYACPVSRSVVRYHIRKLHVLQ
jgi:hypothetical protein